MTRIGMLARTALAAVGRGTSGLRCSFCGRSAADVERLVAGASGYICDTCIAACVAVLDEHGGAPPAGPNR